MKSAYNLNEIIIYDTTMASWALCLSLQLSYDWIDVQEYSEFFMWDAYILIMVVICNDNKTENTENVE